MIFSLIYLISIAASPICGGLVDYFGRNVFWIVLSVLLAILGHSLLAFSFFTPYIAVVRSPGPCINKPGA